MTFQGWKSKESIPGLVLKYLDKNLMLDEFISHKLPFESINEGFELLHSGKRYNILLFLYIYIYILIILLLFIFLFQYSYSPRVLKQNVTAK